MEKYSDIKDERKFYYKFALGASALAMSGIAIFNAGHGEFRAKASCGLTNQDLIEGIYEICLEDVASVRFDKQAGAGAVLAVEGGLGAIAALALSKKPINT